MTYCHLLRDTEESALETDNMCSCDVKVNTSGRTLLTICSSHSHEIANGQTTEDRFRDVSTVGGQVLWTT